MIATLVETWWAIITQVFGASQSKYHAAAKKFQKEMSEIGMKNENIENNRRITSRCQLSQVASHPSQKACMLAT